MNDNKLCDPVFDEKVEVNIDTPEGRRFYEHMEGKEMTSKELEKLETTVGTFPTKQEQLKLAVKDFTRYWQRLRILKINGKAWKQKLIICKKILNEIMEISKDDIVG